MPVQHYYVGTTASDAGESDSDGSSSHQSLQGEMIIENLDLPPITPAIATLLALPEITVAPSRIRVGLQNALIDYSQSLLLTSKDYVAAMEEKACHREEARV